MKTINNNKEATSNNSLTKKNGRKPDANPTGECPAVQNKCWMRCTFYVSPSPALQKMPGKIMDFISNHKNIWELATIINDGETMVLEFWTVGGHFPDVLRKLMKSFPSIEMKYSTFTDDGNRHDFVRLVGGQVQQIYYPIYLSAGDM